MEIRKMVRTTFDPAMSKLENIYWVYTTALEVFMSIQ